MEQPILSPTPPIEIKYQSDSIENIAKALCEMQKTELLAITDSKNPFFNSKYADLSSNWSAARGPLTTNGLSISQTTEPFPNGVTVVTTLMHTSGEWIKGRLAWEVAPDKHGKRSPQALLSLITYLRRTGVSSIVGTCPEDDDGESTMNRGTSPQSGTKSSPERKNATPKLDADEHTMVDYTMPGEDSEAFGHLKEYRPDVVILNKDKTQLKVGKYIVETNADGSKMWTDVPKFGSQGFPMDSCVPCLVAAMLCNDSVPFVEGKYGINITSEV